MAITWSEDSHWICICQISAKNRIGTIIRLLTETE